MTWATIMLGTLDALDWEEKPILFLFLFKEHMGEGGNLKMTLYPNSLGTLPEVHSNDSHGDL